MAPKPPTTNRRKVEPVSGVVLDEHAKRSPSTLKNREQCPGFEPRPGTSKAATEGTKLHRYMELWAKCYYFTDQEEKFLRADKTELEEIAASFTVEQAETIEKLEGVMGAEFDIAKESNASVMLETKLDLTSLELPGCDFGTADVLIVGGDGATLVDYKFGKVEVDDPEDNVQFHAYALAVFIKYPDVTNIHVLSLQPRLDVKGEAQISRVDIERLHLRLKTVVERCEALGNVEIAANAVMTGILETVSDDPAQDPGYRIPQFNPQVGLCNYCAYVGTCPAVAMFALKVMQGPAIPEELDPAKLTDNEEGLGDLYAWTELLEAKAKSLKQAIVDIALSGSDVGGFTLITRAGKNSIVDPVGLAGDIAETYGFTPEQIYSCSDISLTQVAEIVGKAAKRGEKTTAMQECKKQLLDGGYFTIGKPQAYLQKSK